MKRNAWRVLLYFVTMTCLGVAAGAAFGQEQVFKGKTIRLIVGLAPGGGFDTYARVMRGFTSVEKWIAFGTRSSSAACHRAVAPMTYPKLKKILK